jgi:endoglucanase
MSKPYSVPTFLTELLAARSPSGYEAEAQAVFDRHVKPAADAYAKDAMGNRLATLNPKGDPTLMLAGHIDELGLIITYVNDKGFVYFETIGGHDRIMIPGRRVQIQTSQGARDPRTVDRHRSQVEGRGAGARGHRRRGHVRSRF